jgi:hyperosmotically inducible protein
MADGVNRNFAAFLAVTFATLLTLGGCDRDSPPRETVGQQIDKTIDKTKIVIDKAGDKAAEAARSAEQSLKGTATKLEKSGEQVAAVLGDSAITAAIKTELIKEPALKALKIDVNTVNGEVTLRGEVADQAARANAERIALSSSGVVKVNNLLRIAPGARKASPLARALV